MGGLSNLRGEGTRRALTRFLQPLLQRLLRPGPLVRRDHKLDAKKSLDPAWEARGPFSEEDGKRQWEGYLSSTIQRLLEPSDRILTAPREYGLTAPLVA